MIGETQCNFKMYLFFMPVDFASPLVLVSAVKVVIHPRLLQATGLVEKGGDIKESSVPDGLLSSSYSNNTDCTSILGYSDPVVV